MPALPERHAGGRRHVVAAGLSLAAMIAVAAMAVAGPALAHSLLQSSDPAAGSTIPAAPPAVTITFGEAPDPKLSAIKVLDTSGRLVTSGATVAVAGQPDQLQVPVGTLPAGWYTVTWRTVSAVDGHAAAGTFGFGVGVAAPSPPAASAGAAGSAGSAGPAGPAPSAAPAASAAPAGAPSAATTTETDEPSAPSPLAVLGRWLQYLGLIVLLGTALLGGVIAPASGSIPARVLVAAWVIAALGVLLVVGAELAAADVDLATAIGTSLGGSIVARSGGIAVAGAGVLLALARPGRRGEALGVLAGGAAGTLLADAAASHAAAGPEPSLDVFVQWVHVVAVALWLGGLAGLLIATRGTPDGARAATVRRYSQAAAIGIAIVAISGVLRAIPLVGTFDGLVGTDYGRLVLAKAVLLAALAGLGAINRWRSVPEARSSLGRLRRVGSLELLVGATAILLAASLVNLAPPATVAATPGGLSAIVPPPSPPASPALPSSPGPSPVPASTPGSIVAAGHDFGTSVKVRLDVSPGTPGPNSFRATVTDYDTGQPVDATGVTLRFDFPGRPDVAESRLDLVPAAAGAFTGQGGNLSLQGDWTVTATVALRTGAVEVPLQALAVVTASPAVGGQPSATPQVDVVVEAGLPTIYTIHLAEGRSIQCYLDPTAVGSSEFHATVFGSDGVELPVTDLVIAIGVGGAAPLPVVARMLEPGHFVAAVEVVAGTQVVSLSGHDPSGAPISVTFDMEVAG